MSVAIVFNARFGVVLFKGLLYLKHIESRLYP